MVAKDPSKRISARTLLSNPASSQTSHQSDAGSSSTDLCIHYEYDWAWMDVGGDMWCVGVDADHFLLLSSSSPRSFMISPMDFSISSMRLPA